MEDEQKTLQQWQMAATLLVLLLMTAVVPLGPSGIVVHTLSSLYIALIFGIPCIFFLPSLDPSVI